MAEDTIALKPGGGVEQMAADETAASRSSSSSVHTGQHQAYVVSRMDLRKESPIIPDGQDNRPVGSATTLTVPLQQQQDLQLLDVMDDDPVYRNEDDAQSLIQPAISPVATRLASVNTPAAEKAAAIRDRPGYFDPLDAGSPDEPDVGEYEEANPLGTAAGASFQLSFNATQTDETMGRRRLTKPNSAAGAQPRPHPESTLPLPSPWRPGPKRMVEEHKPPNRTSSSILGGARHRSLSAGTDALKRIQKALPSISMPTNFLASFNAPSFLVSNPPPTRTQSQGRSPVPTIQGQSSLRVAVPTGLQQDVIPEEEANAEGSSVPRPRPVSVTSSKRLVVRRSTSDDSLLYHNLSRVSSLGDDDKYANVSEQVNSRFKAIVDSLPDRPSFKLPQMPNIVASPLKRLQSTTSPQSSPTASTTTASGNALDRVLETLKGDVVVLGGYRGSVLRSARTNRQLWVPVKVGLNIRQVNLALPLDDSADVRSEETVIASGMLQNIGPIDISRRLFRKLRDSENCKNGSLRVWDYGYDWRLDPHILSQKLQKFLEGLPSNQPGAKAADRGALVIAHSLGGIITRHAVNAQPELFSGVVYAGTPTRCINILGPLRNGDAVLLNEKALTAAVNFSLRTSFIFLPEDGKCFLDKETGEELVVDFYDARAWVDNKLSPVVGGPALPPPPREEASSPFGSFINLSSSLGSSLPRRGRKESEPSKMRKNCDTARPTGVATGVGSVTQRAEVIAGVAPQLDSTGLGNRLESHSMVASLASHRGLEGKVSEASDEFSYLARTLAATKRFRLQTQYQPSLSAANTYPPIGIIYGRGTPTVYRARVDGREAIPTTEAYDSLTFRDGDGVVLAREAMPPVGYGLARGGKVCSTKGHLGLLGDLDGVGKVLEAVVEGRHRGIGLGIGALRSNQAASTSGREDSRREHKAQ